MTRTAVYVAGDRNIVFPAVVALASFAQHNPEGYDFLIFSEPEALDDREKMLLKVNGIELINVRELGAFADKNVFDSREMQEGRWPVHVLLNWAAPQYLGAAGYTRSVKLDYDVLILGSVDLLLQKEDEFCAKMRRTKKKCKLTVASTRESADILSFGGRPDADFQRLAFSVNAGVGVFNNDWAEKVRLFDIFLKIYNMMQKNEDPISLYEQAALALIFKTAEPPFVELDPIYNCYARTEYVRFCRSGGKAPVILHYMGAEKPWKMTFDAYLRLPERFRQRYSDLPLTNNMWVKVAQALPGVADFMTVPALSEEQLYFLARRYGDRVQEDVE